MAKMLAVRLLGASFKAVYFDNDTPKSWYASKSDVTTFEEFADALKESVEATGYRGKYVSFVYEGPKTDHVFISAPTMTPKNLALFLKRKVRQESPFEGGTIYSYSRSPSPKGEGDTIHLHMLEREFHDNLVATCTSLGLYPIKLIPTSTVLSWQLQNSGFEEKQLGGILAEVGDQVSLLIGKSDGSILFERTFHHDWSSEQARERLGMEVNRSVLFAKQQFGVPVDRVVVAGGFSEEFTEVIRTKIDLPVDYGGGAQFTHFWGLMLNSIDQRVSANFISPSLQAAAQRKILFRVTISVVALLWLVAGSSAAWIEWKLRDQQASLRENDREIQKLSEERRYWESKLKGLGQLEKSVALISQCHEEPVPGWFVGYLGNTLPEGLTLTDVTIRRSGQKYDVALKGRYSTGQKEAASRLARFEQELKTGPYAMTVSQSWRKQWKEQLKAGAASNSARQDHFTINGSFL